MLVSPMGETSEVRPCELERDPLDGGAESPDGEKTGFGLECVPVPAATDGKPPQSRSALYDISAEAGGCVCNFSGSAVTVWRLDDDARGWLNTEGDISYCIHAGSGSLRGGLWSASVVCRGRGT